MSEVSFPDAVAQRSGYPVDEVTRVLKDARVPTTDAVGAPHRLRIERLAFTGQKAGVFTDPIAFDQTFSTGLWAITSDKNDAGKTSLLEIIMWCIRGQPKRLQDDVRAWLDQVTLQGTVDDEAFIVEFTLTDGMPVGSLTCGADVRPFASDAAFADTMSQFMMERLGFDIFQMWVDGKGLATHHWPSYSTVLYLPREAESAVIGDTVAAGLAQRLVQLFVGIPWARTYLACQAGVRQSESDASGKDQEAQKLRQAALSTIIAKRAELDAINLRIGSLPLGLPSDAEIADANAMWMSLITQHGNALSNQLEAERNASAATRRAAQERHRLNNLTEAALARRLFHGLDPAKCPRCYVDIGADRKEAERTTHACAVCDRELDLHEDSLDGEPVDAEDGDVELSIETLQELVDDLEATASAEAQRAGQLQRDASALAEQLAAAATAVEGFANVRAQVDLRRSLSAQVIALEAVIEELTTFAAEVDAPVQTEDIGKVAILRSAIDEARDRRQEGFAEIVDEINAAILEIAQRFGFANLQEAKINLAAQLRLTKGGTSTSFSSQTPGEKLRLRIAVVVALLRVAHRFQVGRHPGLLLIDSIGAEETEPGNLAEFMRELESVTAELGIQTIVASARPEILTHVPTSQRISVTGDSYLW